MQMFFLSAVLYTLVSYPSLVARISNDVKCIIVISWRVSAAKPESFIHQTLDIWHVKFCAFKFHHTCYSINNEKGRYSTVTRKKHSRFVSRTGGKDGLRVEVVIEKVRSLFHSDIFVGSTKNVFQLALALGRAVIRSLLVKRIRVVRCSSRFRVVDACAAQMLWVLWRCASLS